MKPAVGEVNKTAFLLSVYPGGGGGELLDFWNGSASVKQFSQTAN